jgi:formate hydrogenlyase subunit 4
MLVVIQVLVIVALAPLLQGAMKHLRARLQGRPGPNVLQSYRDLAKLWSKEALLPDGTAITTLCAPGLALGVALTFAAVLPLTAHAVSVIDVVALAFLLALGRFALNLAALDTRSAFTGMAASREMTFASLVEPTLLLALLGGAILGHGTALDSLLGVVFGPASLLAFAAFFLVMLLETARIPLDNQETHYELTMMHEGLTLEYSGWQLGLVSLGSYVRQLSFFVLAAMLAWPGGGILVWSAVIIALAVAITFVETLFAKLRLFEVPQVLTTAFILAATSVALRILGAAA